MSRRAVAQRVRRRAGLAVSFLIAILISGLAVLLYQQVTSSDRLQEAEQESQERRALMLTVLSAHQDIETGQRGFLITRDEAFLEPYVDGAADLERSLSSLRAALADEPSDLELLGEIERLSAQKRAFSAHTLGLAPVSYTHLTLPTICSV